MEELASSADRSQPPWTLTRNLVHGIISSQSFYENDSVTKDMKQIIQYMTR
jgi:hypothetical protein